MLPERFSKWSLWLVALAAFVLYLPALGYDFVYDSVPQVMIDDFIHQPRHFLDCLTLRVLGMDVLDFNRPTNLMSLIVDAQLWGKNPAGFRLTNLLLHAAVAGLLFRWLRLITGNAGASLLAALAFAVHPLHCETVVEVSYREDLLATVFLLAGLNAAVAFRPGERTWGPGLLATVCFFLSADSKETGIAGPVALAAYSIFLRWTPASGRRAWMALIGAAGLSVGAFYLLRFTLEPKDSAVFNQLPSAIAPLGIDWLQTQTRIWVAEGWRVFWPAPLCADYGPYNLRNIEGTWALLGVLLLGTGAGVLAILNRRAALGCVIFGAALLPVSNLVPIYRPMADRYLYMPMTGLALLLALALAECRTRGARMAGWGAAAAAIALLAAVTLHQQTFWRDAQTLWEEAARVNPYSLNAWIGCGDAKFERGQFREALAFYEKANTLARGNSAQVWGAVALASDALGEHQKASEALARATKLDSRYARPETLVRSLAWTQPQAQRFALIALRTQSR